MAPRRPVGLERSRRGVASITLALVVCAAGAARAEPAGGPKQIAYQPEQPIPAGYHVQRRTRWALVATGVSIFATAYVPTAAAAWYDSGDGTPLYVVPVLGPLFAIPSKTADTCVPSDHNPCFDFDAFITAFMIADALMQATGVLIAWKGFAGRDVLMRDQAPQTALLPGPIGGTGYGAWLTGRF
jgi:hypothetical protein